MSSAPTSGTSFGMKQTTPRPNGLSARANATISSPSAQRLGTGRPSPSKCTGPYDEESPKAPAAMHSATTSAIAWISSAAAGRSEEHTSELQSLAYLVCRLLLEKKKKK